MPIMSMFGLRPNRRLLSQAMISTSSLQNWTSENTAWLGQLSLEANQKGPIGGSSYLVSIALWGTRHPIEGALIRCMLRQIVVITPAGSLMGRNPLINCPLTVRQARSLRITNGFAGFICSHLLLLFSCMEKTATRLHPPILIN